MIQDVLEGRTDHAVLEGDSASVLATLPADLFHCAITSPPYHGLRDYGTGTWEGGDAACDHARPDLKPRERPELTGGGCSSWSKRDVTVSKAYTVCGKCGARRIDQQIGLEQTVEEYLARLVAVFREVRRVLRPDGLLAVNMGESYASSGAPGYQNLDELGIRLGTGGGHKHSNHPSGRAPTPAGLQQGDCMAIPARLMLALQADGWLYRGAIVWHKKSPMPQSLAGWRWERCRVKVAPQAHQCDPMVNGKVKHSGDLRLPHNQRQAQWSPCPGCPRCEPTGGLVLRRGSWRPTPSWEPVYLFARGMGYFADGEAVRQPHAESTVRMVASNHNGRAYGSAGKQDGTGKVATGNLGTSAEDLDQRRVLDPRGANLRDVWDIPDDGEVWRWLAEVGSDALREELARLMPAYLTGDMTDVLELGPEPLAESHYAAFPTSLPTRILRFATSERGVCPWCGAPHARVVENDPDYEAFKEEQKARRGPSMRNNDLERLGTTRGTSNPSVQAKRSTLGWRQTCSCAPTEPVSSIVLDPFSGAASTGVACRRLGLRYVGIELSPEYVRLSRKRLAGCLRQSKRQKAKAEGDLFASLEES